MIKIINSFCAQQNLYNKNMKIIQIVYVINKACHKRQFVTGLKFCSTINYGTGTNVYSRSGSSCPQISYTSDP